ncbi:hypothetical protein N476_09340 [Pseudoalteromonas luteoviolacea H33]|uniref:Uncharacterized protein n=1 Tax=Pseudoalteromonas luteoviolacea H33 TaxID=1365251 RepID=A0A167FTV6_9GAMM|nr:hypothetical protein N476_09340 [Pseudoalteromonas luteoviolacea H33]KZN78105.1 hypothetical protein N477_10725 [Pseudoalteromonas luteoviolacea H33-S]
MWQEHHVFADLDNPQFQDNALLAIERFSVK